MVMYTLKYDATVRTTSNYPVTSLTEILHVYRKDEKSNCPTTAL